MKATAYLYFAGDCAEALQFYRDAIGADIRALVRFGDMRTVKRSSSRAAVTPSHCSLPTMRKPNGSSQPSLRKERLPCHS